LWRNLLPALGQLDIDVSLRDRRAVRWRRDIGSWCWRRVEALRMPPAGNHNSALPFQPTERLAHVIIIDSKMRLRDADF